MNIITESIISIIELAYNFTGDWGIAIVLLTIAIKSLMLPLSIKQRITMRKQVKYSEEMENIKRIYKNNKKKQEEELQKVYAKSTSGMIGCLVTMLQLPIISSFYLTIQKLPLESFTMLVPWVMNLGETDNTFVVPIIYTVISIAPSIVQYIFSIKGNGEKLNKKMLLTTMIFSIIITVKAPIALGIYFITSSIFTLVEDIIFRIFTRNKVYV